MGIQGRGRQYLSDIANNQDDFTRSAGRQLAIFAASSIAGIALLIAPEAGEGWPRSAAEMRRTLSWRLQRIPSGWYTPDGAE